MLKRDAIVSALKQATPEELYRELLRRRGQDLKAVGQMTKPAYIHMLATSVPTNIELIINYGGQFLLIWRKDADFHGWHFPGGSVFQFESYFDTCRRLAMKEAGVEIKQIKPIGLRNYNDPRSDIRHFEGQVFPNHISGLVFIANLAPAQVPKDGEFWRSPPDTLLASHQAIFQIGQSHLKTGQIIRLIEDIGAQR